MPPGHLVAIGCLLLNALRRGRGLKPEALALLAGRSAAQIRAWEYDEEPIWPTLVELCVTHMKYKVWEVEELYDCFSRIHGLSGRDSTHLLYEDTLRIDRDAQQCRAVRHRSPHRIREQPHRCFVGQGGLEHVDRPAHPARLEVDQRIDPLRARIGICRLSFPERRRPLAVRDPRRGGARGPNRRGQARSRGSRCC